MPGRTLTLFGLLVSPWIRGYNRFSVFIAFFSVLSVGGDLAATNANLSTDFLLVLVGLILLFMTVIEYLGRRRDLGSSYLPPGLREALRAPLFRRWRT